VDCLIHTIQHILNLLQLWHNLGLNMYLQLLIELIRNLNKNFIHHEIHVTIFTLSHNLFQSLCCFKLILHVYNAWKLLYIHWAFHWHPLIASKISNHLCLHDYPPTIKTRPTFCQTLQILVFIFNPNPLQTPNHVIEVLKLWLLVLLKKKIEFRIKNPPHNHAHPSFFNLTWNY
jgi:hypothetical protein